MKIKSTINGPDECMMLARYLDEKHRGSGGAGLLQKAMIEGDVDSLHQWFVDYGLAIDKNLWRKSAQWLYNQRVKSRSEYTSARLRSATHERLKRYVIDEGFSSISDAIDSLLQSKR